MTEESIKQLIRQELQKGYIMPIGAIIAFPSENIPDGFLPCEGQELSRRQFPELSELLGNTFGGSASTFNLPDLQGQFIRGLDREGNLDLDEEGNIRKIGSIQDDSLQGHQHDGYINSNGGHDHKVYVDSKNPISYGTNTFSSDNTSYLRIPKTPSSYESNKNSSAYDFSDSVETTYCGSHSHSFAIKGAINDTYGKVRIASETRPTNVALIFCIKVK